MCFTKSDILFGIWQIYSSPGISLKMYGEQINGSNLRHHHQTLISPRPRYESLILNDHRFCLKMKMKM